MLKKILIIILIIFLVVIIGLFILALSISQGSGGKVSVQESFRELVSFGETPDNIFSKIGTGGILNTDFSVLDDSQADDIDIGSALLRKVAPFPVAGMTSLKSEDGATLVRFIARENGHIFETTTDSAERKRISNTTILGIRDALWLSSGIEFITGFLDDENSEIESFYAKIKLQNEIDAIGTLDGAFLPKNITELALSGDKNKIFYLTPSGGGSIGIISDPNGDNKVQVFDSKLSEWEAQWPAGNKIALTTKASSDVAGHMYFLNSDTKKLERVFSGIDGLTTLSDKDGKRILFTSKNAGRFLLSVLDIKSGDTTDLPVWTFAEKCVWSEKNKDIVYCGVPDFALGGSDLDIWYQGLVSFSDNLWAIDTKTQTTRALIEPINIAGEEIDVIKPTLSPNEDYLFFINKKDSNLWQLKLE